MINNSVRRALLNREITIGSWIQIGHAASPEILANVGYDWIGFDCEHSDIDIVVFSSLMRGAFGRGSAPFVRVKENDALNIRQALDMGACGVIVPLINNPEEAQQAVTAAKFPPLGNRGYGYCRANNYGKDFASYAATANDETCVIAMIESKEGIKNIEEILAVKGIDGVFVGPYDLSGSYGIPGQTDHHLILEARKMVLDACKKANKSAGLHIVKAIPDNIAQVLEEGFTFIALGADIVFLRESAEKALDVARSVSQSIQALITSYERSY